ncbi:hypothetical protein [Cesiribacter andamanensis]|uniref:Uncharacterized protein n=1 Tax=Cesiribacter andamanensis AMV16 TaxID=1279009 RepID=M7NP08_9BACT|nr:hypothetical protein [Cesiribacter andamanensis]EMR03460.1 hypothetical protein ADICEAN_01393 [Cesiribacter andamanensis AMV16]
MTFRCLSCLILPLLLLFGTSCSRDEGPLDVRDELSGTYSYKSGGISGLSSALTLEISKHSVHPDRISLLLSPGDLSFYAEEIIRSQQGIHFRIPPQLVVVSGLPMVLEGKELVELAGMPQQAAYTPANRELSMGLQLALMTPTGPRNPVAGVLVTERK